MQSKAVSTRACQKCQNFPDLTSHCSSESCYGELSEHSCPTGHGGSCHTQETEVGGLSQGPGWPGLQSEF